MNMKKISLQLLSLLLAGAMVFGMAALIFAPIFLIRENTITADKDESAEDDTMEGEGDSENSAPPSAPDDSADGTGQDGGSALPPEEQPEKTPKSIYIRSLADGLSIRSGAGTGYAALGHINKGDMLHYDGKAGNWYKTIYKNKTAYISASSSYTELYELEHGNDDEAIEAVISEGLNLLGFVYVYGAIRLHDGNGNLLSNFDATKYDCSSLMQYIFYHGAGVNLKMTTRTQVSQGSFVAKSKIARGDLLFFTNSSRYNKTGVERIGHVALYLGDNYILHTASDYAVIEQISSTRWGYYIEARRVY